MPDDDFEVILTERSDYVTTDGEFVVTAEDLADAGDALTWMVAQLADAKSQAGEWTRRRRVFEQLLITALGRADTSRVAAGGHEWRRHWSHCCAPRARRRTGP